MNFSQIVNDELACVINSLTERKRPENAITLFQEVFPDFLSFQQWQEAGSNPDTPHLFKWQEDVMHAIFDPLIDKYDEKDLQIQIALMGANGCGKTVFLAMVVLVHMHYCYTYENHRLYSGGVYSGNRDQLKQAIWKNVGRQQMDRGFFLAATKLYINERFEVVAKTWNRGNLDSTKGVHDDNVLLIFDEGTAICDEVYERTETFSSKARFVWIVTGNPSEDAGHFTQLFVDERAATGWFTKNISIYDSFPEGTNFARTLITRYGDDSDEVRQMVYGLPPLHSTNSFFPRYIIDEAMSKNIMPITHGTPVVMGLDFASGRGKDYSVIAVRSPTQIVEIIRQKIAPSNFIEIVFQFLDRYVPRYVAFDMVGIGELMDLVIGRIRSRYNNRIRIIPVNGGFRSNNPNYINLKTELYMKMKDWMSDCGRLPPIPDLRNELSSLTYFNSAGGKISAVTKKEIEKSPDMVDAIAYTFVAHFY